MAAMTYEELENRLLRFVKAPEEGMFEELALEVFRFQKKNNAAYANYAALFPEPLRVEGIPAVPLRAFKERGLPLKSFEGDPVACFRTSGTTGAVRGEHYFCSLRLYEAAAREGWARAGLPEKVDYCLMPSPQEATDSSLSRMAGWLADEGAFMIRGGRLEVEELENKLRREEKPVTIFGTALAFLHFFEELQARHVKLQLPQGSVAVETGGYKGSGRELEKEAFYAMFAEYLGLPPDAVANEYGMTELSSQFYTRGLGRVHKGAPWVRAFVIDPRTQQEVGDGGTGVLKIVDLANLGSVCALLTQDLAVRRGADFVLLGRDPAALPRGCSRAADEMLTEGRSI